MNPDQAILFPRRTLHLSMLVALLIPWVAAGQAPKTEPVALPEPTAPAR